MHTSTTPLLSNGIGYSALSPPMSVSASTICHKVPSNGNLLATLSHDSPALFAVGGGASGLPRGSNTALSAFGSSTAVVEAQAQDATVARDSSQTVVHNGRVSGKGMIGMIFASTQGLMLFTWILHH